MLDDLSLATLNWKGSVDEKSSGRSEYFAKTEKSYFGFSKAFFTELFLPKENTFKNNLFDLTVEGNRFVSYPYFFDESSQKKNKRENKSSK